MSRKISAYWLCQIGGWSSLIIIYTFFYLSLGLRREPHFFQTLVIDALTGLAVTHLMRFLIIKINFLKYTLERQIIYILITTLGFSLMYSFLCVYLEDAFQITPSKLEKYGLLDRTIITSIGNFLFLIIWNLIYFTYHYVVKSRQEQLDKIQLQSVVKELELKTIKAHINPHFIFNALNSIRALVDENPQRARQAITELSNILRSSMQAEKVETAPLSRELNIVKDYLALEHIRFEDRLQVEFDIKENTLTQPVPPMMLQTLVENAIKHGISKKIEGGIIRIISHFKDNQHQLIVKNTGHLNGSYNPYGFGLYSTESRLKLLYGEKARFEIRNNSDNMVEAIVTMPATI
ncbi:MAG: sensor histidine kinase [Segetibacter sp.]|nr:sensor histidine kinase [Segetibacter sp.]